MWRPLPARVRNVLPSGARHPVVDPPRPGRGRHAGFTLVELVLVIVLTGILGTITAVFVVEPMRAYVDQSRRVALVDDAELSLRRMAREIRAAVPNSVRVSGGTQLDFFNAVSGARYRAAAPPNDPDAILEFDRDDGSFDVLGGFAGLAALASTTHRLVIHNLGTAGSDLYEGSGALRPVISPVGSTLTIAGDRVTLDPPFRFGWESPEQRVYVTDGQVSYQCSGGALARNGVTVVDGVTACSFGYSAGSASRFAVASLSLTLANSAGESVTLMRQVHVENLP